MNQKADSRFKVDSYITISCTIRPTDNKNDVYTLFQNEIVDALVKGWFMKGSIVYVQYPNNVQMFTQLLVRYSVPS